MRVIVHNNYSNTDAVFQGTSGEICHELMVRYAHALEMRIRRIKSVNLADIMTALNRQQAFSASYQEDAQPVKKTEHNLDDSPDFTGIIEHMHGFWPKAVPLFEAARFLASGPEIPIDGMRRALWRADEDIEAAALQAYGLPVNDQMRASLKQVAHLQLKKSDKNGFGGKAADVQPGSPTATHLLAPIYQAFLHGEVTDIKLGGKHSVGSMLAKDPETNKAYLLKPGSGRSPAAGVNEDPSSQAQREAAFYQVAKLIGLGDDLPECELLIIDGKQYACMDLLAPHYKPMDEIQKMGPAIPARLLDPYRQNGRLFMWGVIDYILGNADGHAGNELVSEDGAVKLIDHGSAFAGKDFDPAHDQNSFVPFYLRYTAPPGSPFNTLPYKDKMRYLVTTNTEARAMLKQWLASIDGEKIRAVVQQYDINPEPILDRLLRLRHTPGEVDEAVNKMWAST